MNTTRGTTMSNPARTVAEAVEGERAKNKQERWERIILAAAKQNQNLSLPKLGVPTDFSQALKACKGEVTVMAWEEHRDRATAEEFRKHIKGAGIVNLFIGPEGGFSEEEVALAKNQEVFIFGMGPRVLRAETAAVAACSLIQYELGGW